MKFFCPPLFLIFALVNGHGNMFSPKIWFDRGGTNLQIGCGVLDLPDNEYSQTHGGKSPDCLQMWYSNKVKIPGQPTIPEDMAQNDIKCVGQAGAKNDHPWNAPGTAPVFGPCGTLGGNPFGCHGNKTGHFGDCCGNNCDGFALGKNAETYDWPGTVALSHQKVHDKNFKYFFTKCFSTFLYVFCFDIHIFKHKIICNHRYEFSCCFHEAFYLFMMGI